ncbi:MAG TPA: branched-chain amino acid ABC transporter permease [Actinomycetes bacterium]|jgi:branched-chain amino acid transport system permease protein|nr:branched-chain amino acid ABC transporter permease [Actinomycetes bacterium]
MSPSAPRALQPFRRLGERRARLREGARERLSSWSDSLPDWSRTQRAQWWRRWVARLAVVAFLYALPSFRIPLLDTPQSDFASVLFFPVGVYVLLAMGLNVVVGQAGLLDLGYVAFFAIGAYTMGTLGTMPHPPWSFPEILPVAIAVSMVAGVILGTPTLRLRGDYLAIVTLGFGEIVRITAVNTDSIGGPRGISNIPHPPSVGGIRFGLLDPKPYYWLLLTLIIIAVLLVRRLERSRVGRAWTAIREDEDAAALMGVPVFRFKLWSFAIGAGFGGLGGMMYASKVTFINPNTFTLILSILILSAVVLGGSGNLAGVIVGAVVIGYLPERFRNFEQYRVMVFGAALVAMMVFRPQGLIPSRRRAAELETGSAAGGLGALGAEVVGETSAPAPASASRSGGGDG